MKNLIKGALFLALIGTMIVGCEKEGENIQPANNNSNSFRLKSQNYWAVFDSIYSNHDPMFFCQCNCESFETGQSELQYYLSQYPEYENYDFVNQTCSEMMENYGCGKSFADQKGLAVSRIDQLVNSSLISQEEANILVSFIDGIISDPMNIDFENFQKQFDALPNNSLPISTAITEAVIYNSQIAHNYFIPFEPLPGDGPIEPFLVNKLVGGIIGGFTAAILSSIWDEVDGTGASGEGYGKAFAQGFIGGALTSA